MTKRPYRISAAHPETLATRPWRMWLLERLTLFRFARRALGGHWEKEVDYDCDRGRSFWTAWKRLESCSKPGVSAVASWPLHCEGPLHTFAPLEHSHAISLLGKDDIPLENGDLYVERVGGRIYAWIPQTYRLLGRM